MHYVKHFDINGVDTKQVACIELHGKPNAATEGSVGLLGIDVDSPLHDVYKCVAVNGSIYSWELLSSGMSIISATITFDGAETVQFPYINLRTPAMYVVKMGDLVVDKEGYLYQINSLNSTYCVATYCGTQALKGAPYELTDADRDSITTAVKNSLPRQNWTFTLADGSTIVKNVYAETLTKTITAVVLTSPCATVTHNGRTYGGAFTFKANKGDTITIKASSYFGGVVITVNGVVVQEAPEKEETIYEHTVTSDILIEHGSATSSSDVGKVIITDR